MRISLIRRLGAGEFFVVCTVHAPTYEWQGAYALHDDAARGLFTGSQMHDGGFGKPAIKQACFSGLSGNKRYR